MGNVDDEGEDLVLMPDGSILVCGVTVTQTYNYSALLAKFTPTGDLDSTFGTAGTVKEDLGMFDFASNVSLMSHGIDHHGRFFRCRPSERLRHGRVEIRG